MKNAILLWAVLLALSSAFVFYALQAVAGNAQ
jgi:hypothetical protein